jgi:hypothetical protein
MPDEIVKKYRHLYERSDYINLHNVLGLPPKSLSEVIKMFGVGEPDDFLNHIINVVMAKHKEEYLAVTNYSRTKSEVNAKVSVDDRITNWEKFWFKIYLAYEWIHVMLEFCGRGFGNPRYTRKKEVNILIDCLAESTKHCIKKLSSGFNQTMHKAIRELFVSESALEKVLLNISVKTGSSIMTLDDLKNFMEADKNRAYKKVTWPLIQRFASEWDIDMVIVESRLQEILGLT